MQCFTFIILLLCKYLVLTIMLSMHGNASVVELFLENRANTHCLQNHEQVVGLQIIVSALPGSSSLKCDSPSSWCTFMGGLLRLPLFLRKYVCSILEWWSLSKAKPDRHWSWINLYFPPVFMNKSSLCAAIDKRLGCSLVHIYSNLQSVWER